MACNVPSFRARQGTSAYATGAITWDNSTPIDNETFTANMNELKDVTVTPPEQAYEKVDFIGKSAQTVGANAQTVGTATGVVAGNFQNQAVQETSVGMWSVSGTQVLTGDEQMEDVLGLGNSQAITGGYTRYAIGTYESDGSSSRNTLGSYRLYLNNGSEEVTLLLSNVYVKLGDIKPTGADGHYEREFEIMCLAKDGAMEFLD
jgi:hypothetical protein